MDEVLDIVDQQDNTIGKATKSEFHSNPKLIHRTVHFALINPTTKQIMLTRRSKKKTHDGGKICFLGEHILSGESYQQALIRGVQEELGFTPVNFQEMANHIFQYDKQTEFVRFFLVDFNKENIKYDENEIEELIWVDLNQMIKNKDQYTDMTKHWVDNIRWDF